MPVTATADSKPERQQHHRSATASVATERNHMASREPEPSRLMTVTEVAHQLAVGRTTVHNKIGTGELVAVDVATADKYKRQLRVTRKSFDAYCARLEQDGSHRQRTDGTDDVA
jgi:hypothetical protein